MSEDNEGVLDRILQRIQDNGPGAFGELSQEDTSVVFGSFLPTSAPTARSKAFVILTRYTSLLRENAHNDVDQERVTSELVRPLSALIGQRLSSTEEKLVLEGLSFLTPLFQVDWMTASSIFLLDGTKEHISDAIDIFPRSTGVQKAVADLLAQASGHKSCRKLIASEWAQWLESQVRGPSDSAVRSAAALALMKLSRGSEQETETTSAEDGLRAKRTERDLAELMKGLILAKDGPEPLDAIEGLAYMSVEPNVKEMLSLDASFLTRLLSFVPLRKISTAPSLPLLYGIAVIVSNICMYRPRLTQEEAQIDRLRRMTKGGMTSGKLAEVPEVKLEDDESVRRRGKRLVKAGVMPALVSLAKTESVTESGGIRTLVGKAFLSLVEDKENRGSALQAGAGKALMSLIRASLNALPSGSSISASSKLDVNELFAIQALCKLAITASPRLLFGPDESASYDAIRPFSLLLLHPSASLLQMFEALMALTNLASLGPATAGRVATADGLLNKLETLLLDDNTMVRRAATELLCNLVSCDNVFERYSGEGSDAVANKSAASRLHILLALSDVDDLPTRLAASGALATLTGSPTASRTLLNLDKGAQRTLSLIAQLIDPRVVPRISDIDNDTEEENADDAADPGLQHRGVVCMRNILLNSDEESAKTVAKDADNAGAVAALISAVQANVNQPGGDAVVGPAAEALQWLIQHGVELPQ